MQNSPPVVLADMAEEKAMDSDITLDKSLAGSRSRKNKSRMAPSPSTVETKSHKLSHSAGQRLSNHINVEISSPEPIKSGERSGLGEKRGSGSSSVLFSSEPDSVKIKTNKGDIVDSFVDSSGQQNSKPLAASTPAIFQAPNRRKSTLSNKGPPGELHNGSIEIFDSPELDNKEIMKELEKLDTESESSSSDGDEDDEDKSENKEESTKVNTRKTRSKSTISSESENKVSIAEPEQQVFDQQDIPKSTFKTRNQRKSLKQSMESVHHEEVNNSDEELDVFDEESKVSDEEPEISKAKRKKTAKKSDVDRKSAKIPKLKKALKKTLESVSDEGLEDIVEQQEIKKSTCKPRNQRKSSKKLMESVHLEEVNIFDEESYISDKESKVSDEEPEIPEISATSRSRNPIKSSKKTRKSVSNVEEIIEAAATTQKQKSPKKKFKTPTKQKTPEPKNSAAKTGSQKSNPKCTEKNTTETVSL